jgi:hypothetical protein
MSWAREEHAVRSPRKESPKEGTQLSGTLKKFNWTHRNGD